MTVGGIGPEVEGVRGMGMIAVERSRDSCRAYSACSRATTRSIGSYALKLGGGVEDSTKRPSDSAMEDEDGPGSGPGSGSSRD